MRKGVCNMPFPKSKVVVALEAEATLRSAALQQRPEKVRLEIAGQISASTVDPVLAKLALLSGGTHVELHLRHNSGGDVDKTFELIDALQKTSAVVEITYSRYVMSAAAMIWLFFLLRAQPNVQSLPPRKPGVVIYHRPRRANGEYLCFTNEIDAEHPLREPLERKFRIFDDLFEQTINVLRVLGPDGNLRDAPVESFVLSDDGLTYRHYLWRMRDAYYGNQDCLIPA